MAANGGGEITRCGIARARSVTIANLLANTGGCKIYSSALRIERLTSGDENLDVRNCGDVRRRNGGCG